MKQYWLMKSEPSTFSFEDLAKRPNRREPWDGVRNYQARNFMRDQMRVGDEILFYHSNCSEPGVVGLARVASEAYPDPTAFDESSPYFDPKSKVENPRWYLVDVEYERAFARTVSLQAMKAEAALAEMKVVQKGQRLSVQPVTQEEFLCVCRMAE